MRAYILGIDSEPSNRKILELSVAAGGGTDWSNVGELYGSFVARLNRAILMFAWLRPMWEDGTYIYVRIYIPSPPVTSLLEGLSKQLRSWYGISDFQEKGVLTRKGVVFKISWISGFKSQIWKSINWSISLRTSQPLVLSHQTVQTPAGSSKMNNIWKALGPKRSTFSTFWCPLAANAVVNVRDLRATGVDGGQAFDQVNGWHWYIHDKTTW